MGHYPSEPILKFIREWDMSRPLVELLRVLENEWEFADSGYFKLTTRGDDVFLQLHTAGWSGNEDIYDAFEKIKFIGCFWRKSEAGGHHYYKFPKWVCEKGIKAGDDVK